jgi:hypothetical protein
MAQLTRRVPVLFGLRDKKGQAIMGMKAKTLFDL